MPVPAMDSMNHAGEDVKPSAIRLPVSVLGDHRLLKSAVCLGLLLALLAIGADAYPMEIPFHEIAKGWGKTYVAINRTLHRLEALGYVHLVRLNYGRRRLLVQVVWPEPKPKRAKRNGKSSKVV